MYTAQNKKMEKALAGLSIAVLVAEGFEESGFTMPIEAFSGVGAYVEAIALNVGRVQAWSRNKWSHAYIADRAVFDADANDYDALLLPGGIISIDSLRANETAIEFVRAFMISKKPIGALCHAPWLMAETGLLTGRSVTCSPSIKNDIMNAGAFWINEDVVVDNNIVTCCRRGDLPFFCEVFINEVARRFASHKPSEATDAIA
jgi:protease I